MNCAVMIMAIVIGAVLISAICARGFDWSDVSKL